MQQQKRKCNGNTRNKRKPGGQPGNQNARIHGFYSKKMTPGERRALAEYPLGLSMDEEIALLRAKIMEILRAAPGNYEVLFKAMSVLIRSVRAAKLPVSARRAARGAMMQDIFSEMLSGIDHREEAGNLREGTSLDLERVEDNLGEREHAGASDSL